MEVSIGDKLYSRFLLFQIVTVYKSNLTICFVPLIDTATGASNANCAIVNNDDLRKMRADIEKTGKGANREAAILSAADIARMRQSAVIVTESEAK